LARGRRWCNKFNNNTAAAASPPAAKLSLCARRMYTNIYRGVLCVAKSNPLRMQTRFLCRIHLGLICYFAADKTRASRKVSSSGLQHTKKAISFQFQDLTSFIIIVFYHFLLCQKKALNTFHVAHQKN
jgi:hypothetical protein